MSRGAALRPEAGRYRHRLPRRHALRSHPHCPGTPRGGPNMTAPVTPTTPTPEPRALPLLPLKNTVLFPHLFIPLSVGRPQSLAAVEAALTTEEKTFVVVAQKNDSVDQPGLDDLYAVGTRCVIKKLARA